MNPLVQLSRLGQSVWLDFITRDLLRSGELSRLIVEDGLRGMTTNPTIFEKAIAGSTLYDADIRRLAENGAAGNPGRVVEALAVADVRTACDAFRPLYETTEGRDGFVSIEVSPELAYDTEGTVVDARRLWETVDRPNLMVKIPGTAEGLPAIERCLTEGMNVNVTLLFALERYTEVREAYLAALEQRVRRRQPIDRIASVASFFVSRVDSRVDKALGQKGSEGRALMGTIAIANAQVAYADFTKTFCGDRWDALAKHGARVQRPLWASTSTKDPTYSDVYYVEALIAPDTVNTLPPETLTAYRDHGEPKVRIPQALPSARERLAKLAATGIDLARESAALEKEGVEKFAASWAALLKVVESKAVALLQT
jgi:transaldolase